MTFKATVEFVIVFVRLILVKLGADGFTGPRRESDIRYECNFKIALKGRSFREDRDYLYEWLLHTRLLWKKA